MIPSSLIVFIIVLCIVGVALGLFNYLANPMDPKVKAIINAVIVIVLLLWVLQFFTSGHAPLFR